MLNWLDKRTGFVSLTKDFLTEDVPGGASYWYVFGSATLFAMILQIVTGIFLTFYYAPSAATAWESTQVHLSQPVHAFRALGPLLGRVGDDRASSSCTCCKCCSGAPTRRRASCSGSSACSCCSSRSCSVSPATCCRGTSTPTSRRRSRSTSSASRRSPVRSYSTSRKTAAAIGTRDDQPLLRPARLADAGGLGLLVGGALGDLPPQRLGRTGRRRSAHAEAGTFLAGPDVHGRRVFADRLHRDLLPRAGLAAVLDAKADPTKFFVPYPAWYFLSLFGLLALVPPEIHSAR